MAKSCTTIAYLWLFRDSPSSFRTLWSAVIKSTNLSARGTGSPVHFLQGALVILARLQISQFRSFGKCGSCRARVSATLQVFTPEWFLMAQLVDWESLEMCMMHWVFSELFLLYWLCCVFLKSGRRKSEWGRWCARGKRQVREQQRVRHVQNQMTDSFQTHTDETAIRVTWAVLALEPSAWCAFRACEQTVLHRCALWVGVLSTHPVDFLEFFPRNRNHHHFSDDVGCHELQLVCHCEVGHCEVEDEDATCGFNRGSL